MSDKGDDTFKKEKKSKRSSGQKEKSGACAGCFKKLFHKMYPATPKRVWTAQGEWLRKMGLIAMIGDFAFFGVALALIGFLPMIQNLFIATVGYSLVLTLREWVIILYLLMKVLALGTLISGQGQSSFGGQMSGSQVVGVLCNVSYNVITIFYIARAYQMFRKSGGIWGTKKTRLPEERLFGKVKQLANKAGEKIEKKLDEDSHAEKLADLEGQ